MVIGEHRRRFAALTILLVTCAIGACSSSSTTTVAPTGPDAVKCQVSVAAPSLVEAGGGAATFSITAQAECAWTASSGVNWISGFSPASGQGNGNVEFRIAANDGESGREG
ncbi:MAG TPA: BACON domain-containing protein, partial [Vicinamibacterales bacterium]|nr:BACON domain-containing protein [Vicinamibacterales bacterium]